MKKQAIRIDFVSIEENGTVKKIFMKMYFTEDGLNKYVRIKDLEYIRNGILLLQDDGRVVGNPYAVASWPLE